MSWMWELKLGMWEIGYIKYLYIDLRAAYIIENIHPYLL